MPTLMILLNVAFSLGVVLVIAGGLLVAMATQHHDHGVVAAGPLLRRRIWSRTPRPHAGSVRRSSARHDAAWGAA